MFDSDVWGLHDATANRGKRPTSNRIMISVIVPVYNTAEYLDECINSIVNQSYQELEIFLVDDGSTDGSSEILDKWQERDSRILVIHKPNNTGVSDSRNIAILQAKGEYISFVDSDDWIDTDMYEQLVRQLEQTSADAVFSGYNRVQKKETISVLPTYETGTVVSVEQALLECMPQRTEGRYNLYNWDKLYRRKNIIQDGKPILFRKEYTYCEDVLWLTEVMMNCESIAFWKGAGYNYRAERDGNTWSALNSYSSIEKCRSALETNAIVYELLKNKGFGSKLLNRQYQRLLYYQRIAFRTAASIGDVEAYRKNRKGYVIGLFKWYAGNRTKTGLRWLIVQFGSDLKFQSRQALQAMR